MTTLYYVHDPMCSWCYGFGQTWLQLQAALPDEINIIRVLGGLAADTDEPMPDALRQQISNGWHRIEQHIPGVKFNFDFWDKTQPRRSTYPACRAVIAARKQGKHYDLEMTSAIQQAYYQQTRNPSDDSTLIELADEIGLKVTDFKNDLVTPATQQELYDEIQQARVMHADSFPNLVLEHNGGFWPIAIDYNSPQPMFDIIEDIISHE